METMTMDNNDITTIISTTRRGDITFHKNGRIDITAHVARTLDIHPGDVVNIAIRGDRCLEYYLYVVKRKEQTVGRHACTCRNVKNNGNYLRVFSKTLALNILKMCPETDKVSVRVGRPEIMPDIGPALPLITRQLQSLNH